MAYIKYKEITRYFNFSMAIEKKDLPNYVFDYIFEGEMILDSYKTSRDYSTFTDKKIILFDRPIALDPFNAKKEITIIPYKSISTCSIAFHPGKAELCLFLDSGYPLRLKFVNMKSANKNRLRQLFYCISKKINNMNISNEDIEKLHEYIMKVNNNI